jgi:m7GpppX diphosphatase
MNGKNELKKIIHNDIDFILMPDLKWSTTDFNMNDMYYLAIFKNKELRSIRDLNKSHLPLLNKVRDISINKIKELHNIDGDQLRLYFHYHPSFWQLHMHINLITKPWHGALSDCAHLLSTVINNIELVDNYYQKAIIEVNASIDY